MNPQTRVKPPSLRACTGSPLMVVNGAFKQLWCIIFGICDAANVKWGYVFEVGLVLEKPASRLLEGHDAADAKQNMIGVSQLN